MGRVRYREPKEAFNSLLCKMQEGNIYTNGSIIDVAQGDATVTAIGDGRPPFNPDMNREKKRTKFGILKLAGRLFQSRSKSDQKQYKEISTQPAKWEKIVGSMRPLHLQENVESPTRDYISNLGSASPSPSFFSKKSGSGSMSQCNSALNLQDLDQPMSQYGSAGNLQDFDTPMSQYASAANLQELDAPMSQNGSANNLHGLVENDEEGKDPDEVFDRISGDDMIDLKAEEFIAMFYEGMRLERSQRRQNNGGRRWV